MKVLFAVNNEKISETIIKRYQKEYKEIISGKNVYYFNAIFKELQKDKSYDRIIISEDLEPFSNNNYDAIDKFIFEKLDQISDEAFNQEGANIPIILIGTDRRTRPEPILVRLFGIGIYDVLVGQDRSVEKVCNLLNKPRSKKEAKMYYKIDSESVEYKAENENDVSEKEIQNILAHYKKIGKNEEKYVQSFNSIAEQYNDEQLKLIINFLPKNVTSVLAENSPRYRVLMGIDSRKTPNVKAGKTKDKAQKIEFIEKELNKQKLNKPVIIPTSVNTSNVKRRIVAAKPKVEEQEETKAKNVNSEQTSKNEMKENVRDMETRNSEKKIKTIKPEKDELIEQADVQEVKRGRGRPRKIKEELPNVDSIVDGTPKRKRGRPPKNKDVEEKEPIKVDKNDTKKKESIEPSKNKVKRREVEQEDDDDDDIFDGIGFVDYKDDESSEDATSRLQNDNDDDEMDLPGFDDFEDEENNEELPGFDEVEEDDLSDFEDEEDEDDGLPGFEEDEEESEQAMPGFDDDEDEESNLQDFEDEEDEDDGLPGFEDDEEESEQAMPGFDDDEEEESNIQDIEDEEDEDDGLPGFEDDEDDEYSESNPHDAGPISNPNFVRLDPISSTKQTTKQIENVNKYNSSLNFDIDNLITSNQKVVSFVGTSKNGTSFIVNNLAQLFAEKGIDTAILDLTKNRNAYYIYTDNREDLRAVAHNCIDNLRSGVAEGIKVDRHLTVYTSLPDETDGLEDYGKILETLINNYSIVLLDCDFETRYEYFNAVQEIYLVQSFDILTIQPLTAFLRELKARDMLNQSKLRIVINKHMNLRDLTDKLLIGGMSSYNDPSMSFMTELFNKNEVKYYTIPFDVQAYTKYLNGLVDCKISLRGYSKGILQSLEKLANQVFPLINGKNTARDNNYNNYNSSFSSDTNGILNKMKKKY